MSRTRLLLVEDDPEIASALARGLALHGYDTTTETRADTALKRLVEGNFDAAILDVMLGGDSGLDLCRAARARGLKLPVLILSALDEVDDRAAGLEAGADDYIVKPFDFDELIARLRVQQRRMQTSRARLDTVAQSLTVDGATIPLTERECALLSLLARNAGAALSRGDIFDALWAGAGTSSENVVDVYIGHLRRKLDGTATGFQIVTRRNHDFLLTGTAPILSEPPD